MIRDDYADGVEDEVLFEIGDNRLGQVFFANEEVYRLVIRSTQPNPPQMTVNYSEEQLETLVGGELSPNMAISRDFNLQNFQGERFYFETCTYRFTDIARHFNSLTVTPFNRILPDGIGPRPIYLIFTTVFDLNSSCYETEGESFSDEW